MAQEKENESNKPNKDVVIEVRDVVVGFGDHNNGLRLGAAADGKGAGNRPALDGEGEGHRQVHGLWFTDLGISMGKRYGQTLDRFTSVGQVWRARPIALKG